MKFKINLLRRFLPTSIVQKRFKTDLKWSYSTGLPPQSPLTNETLGQVVQNAANRFDNREAIVDISQGIRKTFSEVYQEAFKLATAFSNIGLKQGDMIGIWAPNCYEWFLTQCAAAIAGCVLVNINPAYQKDELSYVLKKVPVKGLICPSSFNTQRYYDIICDLTPELRTSKPGGLNSELVPHLKTIMILKTPEDQAINFYGTYCFKSLSESGGTAEDASYINGLVDIIQADDVNNIQFTSGTTGMPKAVMLSHFNAINNARFLCNRIKVDVEPHVISLWVPFFHTFGCVGGSLSCLLHGAKLVLPSTGFDPVACVKSIPTEKCTYLFGTPTMFIAVLEAQKVLNADVSSVDKALSGGANFAVEVSKPLQDCLNVKTVINVYGATETSPATFCSLTEDSLDLRVGTVGPPFPYVEAKIVDRNGRVVPVNTPGELWLRTVGIMHGYYDDEIATKKAIRPDGYYRSGDLAIINEKGYCKILGRLDDTIIRGGENIYPKEIEDFLSKHPSVVENYVVGLPDSKMGEEICAWIALKPGADEFDVKKYCKGKISHFKIPKYVFFVNEFPKTLSGKVKKFEIKDKSIKMLGLN